MAISPDKSPLPASWDVPAIFRHRLGISAGRQRAMQADGHLLLVLHAPPQPEEEERHGRYFWRNPEGQWRSSDLGTGPNALKSHLEQYAAVVEKFDAKEDHATSAEDYFAVLEGMGPVCRAAQHLHQVLQQAREAAPDDRTLINLRDQAYAIERRADLLYATAKNGLDYAVARRSEEQAQASHRMSVSAHRLNLLAAFFFPVATLSAVFGVNMRHTLEERYAPYTFLVFVAAGLLCGTVLTLFIMRKPRLK
jgi:hypothetical protein